MFFYKNYNVRPNKGKDIQISTKLHLLLDPQANNACRNQLNWFWFYCIIGHSLVATTRSVRVSLGGFKSCEVVSFLAGEKVGNGFNFVMVHSHLTIF